MIYLQLCLKMAVVPFYGSQGWMLLAFHEPACHTLGQPGQPLALQGLKKIGSVRVCAVVLLIPCQFGHSWCNHPLHQYSRSFEPAVQSTKDLLRTDLTDDACQAPVSAGDGRRTADQGSWVLRNARVSDWLLPLALLPFLCVLGAPKLRRTNVIYWFSPMQPHGLLPTSNMCVPARD
jgi:hypothetical protein